MIFKSDIIPKSSMTNDNAPLQISRKLFCIKDGEVKVPSSDELASHTEWFQNEGWIDENNANTFLETTERGYYSPENNTVYAYIGKDFSFTEKTISQIKSVLNELEKSLELKSNTKICFGPKDSFFNGTEHPQYYLGILEEFLL